MSDAEPLSRALNYPSAEERDPVCGMKVDPATAYVAEMKLVRTGVGISDVSSLGKIEVQGPDAGGKQSKHGRTSH